MGRRKLIIPLAVVAAAAGVAGAAYGATQSASSPQQAVIADAAKRLHVTPAQLTGALKQAVIDQIEAAVRAGRLTRAQADALERRIDQGSPVPFAPWLGPVPFAQRLSPVPFAPRLRAIPFLPAIHPGFGGRSLTGAAAAYLGLTDRQLLQQLLRGKSLAEIARARGRTTGGLEQAILTDIRARLGAAVAGGWITRARERQMLAVLAQFIDRIINASGGRVGWGLGRLRHAWARPGVPPGPYGAYIPGGSGPNTPPIGAGGAVPLPGAAAPPAQIKAGMPSPPVGV